MSIKLRVDYKKKNLAENLIKLISIDLHTSKDFSVQFHVVLYTTCTMLVIFIFHSLSNYCHF